MDYDLSIFKFLHRQLLIVFILFFFNNYISFSQTVVGHSEYHIYSNEDNINSNQIFHVEVGPRGLVYIANSSGLHEYDGNNWRILDTGESGLVRAFKIDPRTGIIYFGKPGELAYLRPDRNGNWKYQSINKESGLDLGKFSDIWNVRLVKNTVYFQSYKKLFAYNIITRKMRVWVSETFFSLTGVVDNQLYIGQSERGLYAVIDDSLTLLSDDKKLKSLLFYNIVPYNESHILITSTDQGVFVDKKNYKPDPNMNWLVDKLKPAFKNRLYNISNLQNGRFGISTFYNGIYFLDSLLNIESVYNKDDGLPTNLCWYTTQSKNGTIWAALDNGMLKISPDDNFVYFDKNELLKVRVITMLRQGKFLFLGTNEGLFKLNIENINRLLLEETEIKAPVWSIKSFNNTRNEQSIIFATADGIWELSGNSYKMIVKQASVGTILVSKAHSNRVYYCYNRGISFIENNNGAWSKPTNLSDLKMTAGVVEDSSGNLLVYTRMQGAYLLRNDGVNDLGFSSEEVFIDSSSINIYHAFLLQDTVVLSTSKGFYNFHEDINCFVPDPALFKFSKKGLLPGQICKVNDDEFWIGAYNNQSSYLFHYYKEGDLFKADQREIPFFKYKTIEQIYYESENRMWLSLNGKLLLLKDLTSYTEDTSSVNVLVRKVSLNNDSVIFSGTNYLEKEGEFFMNLVGVTSLKEPIDYDFNNISFEFGCSFFEKEWLNEYSFMLEGFEDKWSEWSTERKKEYTNLTEGHYAFKVKARNIYDKESEIYVYNFTIKPPCFRSVYAYISYFTILILLIGTSIWRFRKKHKRERGKLENIITERTSEIVKQKEKIENQAELLGVINQELHKLSFVASKVSNPVIICSVDGIMEWVNDSYCSYFGRSQKEFINNNYNLLDFSCNPNIKKLFQACVNEKRVVTYTVNANDIGIRRDLWMQTTLNPIVDKNGNVINVISISSDITYLQELNNTRDMVISVITHDLKSPLLAFKMIAASSLNHIRDVNKGKLEKNLSELYSHSTEVYEFLQYLSEWLKSQRGSLTFFPHAFDISKTINEVLNLFKMSLNLKNIRLNNGLSGSIMVFADENMIKTVLRNLISNAIKFSKAGGIVNISSNEEDDDIVISISDEGIGISDEKKNKLFSINDSDGLGLIICKEFIQKNKGKIWIEDKTIGATINFKIPACNVISV